MFVFAILGLLFCGIAMIALIFEIVFGYSTKKKVMLSDGVEKREWIAKAGTIIGIAGLGIGIVLIIMYIATIGASKTSDSIANVFSSKAISSIITNIVSKTTNTSSFYSSVIDSQPSSYRANQISSSELLNSDNAALEKSAISTTAEAIAYLNKRYPYLWDSYHLWQGANSDVAKLRSGSEILDDTGSTSDGKINAGRSDIDTAVAYLLSDNMDIGTIYGFSHSTDNSFNPIMAANYIVENGKYVIFDPVIGMTGDKTSQGVGLLPEMTVSSLADYATVVAADSTLSSLIDSLYAVDNGQGITFTYNNLWTTVTEPTVSPFYANKDISNNQTANIIPENINKYKLPTMLGGLTLTVADAKALVGQTPEVIKAKVKTAGDLLLYMLASKMLLKNGDEQMTVDGHTWHYNDTAQVTLAENLGNCGRMANLANYLLAGDYDEIGFILQSWLPSAGGGGHVYNYIKYQGKYYIVDFSSYLFDNYNPQEEPNFISMVNLADYGTRWNECYGGVGSIIAQTSTVTHLPNVWEGNYCYYPKGADFTVLYQTPKCMVSTLPCPSAVPDWN
jgi:hypothetical protein